MKTVYKYDNLQVSSFDDLINELAGQGWAVKDRILVNGSSPAIYDVILSKEDNPALKTSTVVEFDEDSGDVVVVFDPAEVKIVSASIEYTGEVIIVETLLNL